MDCFYLKFLCKAISQEMKIDGNTFSIRYYWNHFQLVSSDELSRLYWNAGPSRSFRLLLPTCQPWSSPLFHSLQAEQHVHCDLYLLPSALLRFIRQLFNSLTIWMLLLQLYLSRLEMFGWSDRFSRWQIPNLLVCAMCFKPAAWSFKKYQKLATFYFFSCLIILHPSE